MNRPTIRTARASDAESLGRLGTLLVQEHHDFDNQRFFAPGPRTLGGYTSFLAAQITEPDAVVLVADADGRVVGYAYAAIEGYDYMALRGPAAVLQDLIVDPGARGRGIGRALLEAMLDVLKSRQVPRVLLSTAQRNTLAQQFFEHIGFRRTMVEMTRELA